MIAVERVPRRALLVWFAAVALVIAGAVALAFRIDTVESGAARERLDQLEAALGNEIEPPAGAQLLDRRANRGDSGGASIEWEYRFPGTAASFVDSYRRTLAPQGWTEVAARGGSQLAVFERQIDGRRFRIDVSHPPPATTFVVTARGG